jgi:DNA-binding NarL/FixJ family response regulator
MSIKVFETSGDDTPNYTVRDGSARSSETGHVELSKLRSCFPGDRTTIVIIAEHVLFRDCLAKCLIARNDNWVAVTSSSVTEWLELAPNHSAPSVVVLCSCNNATTDIQQELDLLSRAAISAPVVLLSEAQDMEHALVAFDHGARGYIPSSVTLDVAVEALHLVRAGGIFIPASCLPSSRCVLTEFGHHKKNDSTFTAREAAVLTALRQGKSNKCIAYDLNMSESTAKVHVRNIMKKLNAKNRTEVAFLTQSMFGGGGS